jgi:hypothetical protein
MAVFIFFPFTKEELLKMGTPWVGVRVSARRRTGLR